MSEQLRTQVLEDAFQSLEQTIHQLSDLQWFEQQLPIVQDTLIAGAIQKFEFVYELSLKMIKRQLQQEAASFDELGAYSFKDISRDALKSGLIDDMAKWVTFRDMRNITSHTYNQDKAMAVYSQIGDFLEYSRFLVEQLRLRN
ncbi:TPA: nucleotidyltransferase substrate binding protein [Mannheimia haemolytica]